MLTHGNLMSQIDNLSFFLPGMTPGENVLSILPPWHIYERTVSYFVLGQGCRQVGGPVATAAVLSKQPACTVFLLDQHPISCLTQGLLKIWFTADLHHQTARLFASSFLGEHQHIITHQRICLLGSPLT